jgi:hypothetical protein
MFPFRAGTHDRVLFTQVLQITQVPQLFDYDATPLASRLTPQICTRKTSAANLAQKSAAMNFFGLGAT